MTREAPRWVSFGLVPFVQLTLAFLVAGLVIAAIGENPLVAAKLIIKGSFGDLRNFGYTLYYATSLIFVGLAVAVAFHAGLFNIGGEGQAYIGGLGIVVLAVALDPYLPGFILIPLAILAAGLFGAAWAFLPGYLQAFRGSHVVITTIMFNFIASALVQYMLVNPLRVQGSMDPSSRKVAEIMWVPKLSEAFGWVGITLKRSPANLSILFALICAVFVYLLIWRSKLGYMIRTVGANQTAAVYGGINPKRITVITMVISGCLAGFMAVNTLLGNAHRLELDFVNGLGFTGIAVALMGRNHPFGIVLAAILFGALTQGGTELLWDMPNMSPEIVILIQGLVVLFTGALEYMVRPFVERSYLRLTGGEMTEAEAG